ncbi:phenylacetate--CoA ligase family protein [Tepidamorphus sp. 3E244]|uniref:phenylacetate--CoA ligase family protein n=1 Tax=Tepidamorphus sp. 3E244 TaxID=3385498 RepID=UPI0038FC5028
MAEHFDDLETRSASEREAALFEALPHLVAAARDGASGWGDRLADVDAGTITSREALATLPVLRKPELMARQADNPPFGGFAATGETPARLFFSPGPVFEPEGRGANWFGAARALHAAGLRKGDVALNCFSYNMTPGGFIMDSGCRALGVSVIPAGPGNTEGQLTLASAYRPSAYVGTPDFLKIILDKASETGADVSSFKRALVSGGALFPSLRAEYKERGVDVLQCYATADLGVVAYESDAIEGMIFNEGMILEIVRPGTDEVVPDGEVGEVVVTVLRPDYPLIRFGTGDLSAIMEGESPCGRTNTRIKGWMGRADQRTKVKGMFVDPEQVAAIARRHPGLGKLRLEISRDGAQDVMLLKAESAGGEDEAAVAESLKAVTNLKGAVAISEPGSLPNDGKVIDDQRDYNT